MSTHQGSKLTTNGLVFAMDMNNTQKSFKGKPTTNLITNPTFASGNTSPWAYQTQDLKGVSTSFKYKDFNSAYIQRENSGGETNFYYNIPGLSANTEYTFSAWVFARLPNQAEIFTYFGTNNNGTKVHSGSGKWERLQHTFTTRDTTPYIQLRMRNNSNVIGPPIYFTALQVEENNFATPFVNGTRDANSTIVDLTRNHSVSANSVTYNSNNTFSFGGSDYIRLANAGAVDFTNKSFSVGVWFKKADTNQRSIFGHLEVNETGKSIHYRSYANGALRFDFYGGNVTVADQIVTDTWYYTTTTYDYDSGTTILYLNGESIGSGSVGPYIGNSTTSTTYIGAWQPSLERWNGEVPVVHIYDRAITSTEVKNNFNAYRSRYGV